MIPSKRFSLCNSHYLQKEDQEYVKKNPDKSVTALISNQTTQHP